MKLLSVSSASVSSPVPPKAPEAATAKVPGQQTMNGVTPAPYVSPTMAIDGTTGALIVEYRSAASGLEISQTPSRAALEYRQRQQLTGHQAVDNDT